MYNDGAETLLLLPVGERNVIYESIITDPNGLETYVQYVRGGNLRSLPSPAHKGFTE